VDYLDRLARFVEEVRLDRLTEDAVAAARLVLLDTIGAIAAGSAQPENRRLAEAMRGRGSRPAASLIGHGGRVDPLLATFANATAGVALEVDEGSRLGGGHPAIHVIPAALAVAEDTGADGRRLLEAIIAGYEVCSRLGGATTPRPNVHSHGTWGTIGTAVAVAKLAGLDASGVRSVINLSASMSPANTWTPALEGVTVRNAYPGRSGLEGILAVDLHQAHEVVPQRVRIRPLERRRGGDRLQGVDAVVQIAVDRGGESLRGLLHPAAGGRALIPHHGRRQPDREQRHRQHRRPRQPDEVRAEGEAAAAQRARHAAGSVGRASCPASVAELRYARKWG